MPNMSHKGAQQAPKWIPKGLPKSVFWGLRAEVKLEIPPWRELNFQSPRPPGTELKMVPKSKQPTERLLELAFQPLSRIVARFCRFLEFFWHPWRGVAVHFLNRFLTDVRKSAPGPQKCPQDLKN